MAGRITVSTLNDDTGVLATQNGMKGVAKSWVNFNGITTVTVRGSFNVSSVTRNGVGDFTINFTTAMPDTNYSVVGMVNHYGRAEAAGSHISLYGLNTTGGSPPQASLSTSNCRVTTYAEQSGDANRDPFYCFVSVDSN